jgi:hypothetical protein
MADLCGQAQHVSPAIRFTSSFVDAEKASDFIDNWMLLNEFMLDGCVF